MAPSSDDDVRIIEQLFLPYIFRPGWSEHAPQQIDCAAADPQEIISEVRLQHECEHLDEPQFR